jgi:hypothetical protein
MRVVFLTGSHPRHAYIARSLHKSGLLVGLLIEQREVFVPRPPEGLDHKTTLLFQQHFRGREQAEARHCGNASLPEVERRDINVSELNSAATVQFIDGLRPDLAAETLDSIACPLKWNIHGGLSPWYRGTTTHFWPSYFLEPQMTGMTVHELTKDIDGGAVVHQSAVDMVSGDGIHDLACRAVSSFGDELAKLMAVVSDGRLRAPQKQVTTGRIWREADWQPAHLHLIYDYYQNRIVDHYLEGRFNKTTLRLHRQF